MYFLGLVLVSQLAAFAYGQGGTYGTNFAVSFPPIRESTKAGGDIGYCWLVINALIPSEVTIFSETLNRFYTLTAGETVQVNDIPCTDFRVTGGIEKKVIFVTATQPISLIVANSDANGNMDAITAYPVDTSISNNYYITGYENTGNSGTTIADCGFPNDTSSFYIIVNPLQGNNTVRVYRPGQYNRPVETISLGEYEVYTNLTLVENFRDVVGDFSGYYLEADASIFLISGGLCTDSTFEIGDSEGTTTMGLPPVSRWGTGNHMSYDLRVVDAAGQFEDNPYWIVVLSSEDDNTITIGDVQTRTLNRGESFSIQYQQSFDNFNCEKPCLVTQISENRNQETGVFALQVTPIDFYNTFTGFSPCRDGLATVNTARIIAFANETQARLNIIPDNIFVPPLVDWNCFTKGGVEVCLLVGVVQLDQFQVSVESLDPTVTFTTILYWSGNDGRGYGINTGLAPRP